MKHITPIQSNKSNSTEIRYAATVGLFDGVHAGHRFLIEELKQAASARGLKTLIITFANHPQSLFNPSFEPQWIATLEEKITLLKQTGVDEVIALDFTQAVADLTAESFIQTMLFQQYKVSFLLVGHDHRFGKNRTDAFPEYVNYGKAVGMEVQQAKRWETANYHQISSTTIRKALAVGDINTANVLLTYPYSFSGKVISGYKVGRKIGFPTANLQVLDPHKIIPALGVYMVDILWKNQSYRGMMNIGKRPTIDNSNHISIEVHILDFNQDIYHDVLQVKFLKKIRDEQKFESIEALIKQLHKDRDFVRKNS